MKNKFLFIYFSIKELLWHERKKNDEKGQIENEKISFEKGENRSKERNRGRYIIKLKLPGKHLS